MIVRSPFSILLVHRGRDEAGVYQFRSELSLPEQIGPDGKIDLWFERIILESISDDDGGFRAPLPEFGPDFDVPVIRRAS